MTKKLTQSYHSTLIELKNPLLPSIIATQGEKASQRFYEFFTANIPNSNTREAYYRGVVRFLDWCEGKGLTLETVRPIHLAHYIKNHPNYTTTVKQHLAAIRMFFDWMVIGQIIPMSPASSVRGPKYNLKKGKTPVITAKETRELLNSIDCSNVVGLRDRAFIALMVYSLARVGAVVQMKVEDYFKSGAGKRYWIRLHEKGGKLHELPAHHNTEDYMEAYLEAAGIREEKKSPLFRTTYLKTKKLTDHGMNRRDALRMIKRRAEKIGFSDRINCHTFRATGITTYLQNGGTLKQAQKMANHESLTTTQLYDRTGEQITLDEVERIVI